MDLSDLFSVYRRYPFKIPLRVRFFNLFRFFFTFSFLEKFLVKRLLGGSNFWRRFVPPLYFYSPGSTREASRNRLDYRLDISRLIDHSIYFNTLSEPAWDNLFNYLRDDFIVLDVGANIGYLTLNFARAAPNGTVFSFEPGAQSYYDLLSNIEKNEFNNIKAYNVALGAKTEKVTLYKIYENNPGANRILQRVPDQSCASEEIEVVVLDEVVEKEGISRVDLLKIDVEGFEVFVLQGAEQTINKWRPVLFIELAEVNLNQHGFTSLYLIEYVERLGYQVMDAKTMKPVDRSATDHHTDILCFSNE